VRQITGAHRSDRKLRLGSTKMKSSKALAAFLAILRPRASMLFEVVARVADYKCACNMRDETATRSRFR